MASGDLAALVSMFDDEEDDCDSMADSFVTAPDQSFARRESQSSAQSSSPVLDSPDASQVLESADSTPKAVDERSGSCELVSTPTTRAPTRDFPLTSQDLQLGQSSSQAAVRKQLQSIAKSTADKVTNSVTAGPGVFDPAFGIRVREPKVAFTTFNTYVSDCRKVKLNSLRPGAAPTGEWVTMGVIVDKSPYNTSANGNSYMIWRISDLINTQQVATKVLLFGDCLKQHWKLQTGMVVALTHAQFGDSNDNKGVTLKLMKPGQVIEIGFTPDFGICKATKADGTPCSQFVNLSIADRCVFHLQSEANKFSSRRGALSALSVPQSRAWKVNEPPSRLPAKVPSGVTTVSRPQASRTVIAKPVPMQAKVRQHAQMLSDQKSEEKNRLQELIKKKAAYNAGARSLIRVKAAEREKADDPKGSAKAPPGKQQVSMKQFIQQQMPSSRILQTSGQLSEDVIDLSQSPVKKPANGLKPSELFARKRAAAVLKRKATDDATSDIGPSKRQKGADLVFDTRESATTKKSQLGGSFTDDQIRSLLEKKSAHESEALQEDTERETRYFHSKEAEEKVESYLTGTMEIKNCKVVSCKKCEYTATNQSTYCKIQGHAVNRHLADKRFFRCADCHQRTSAFGLLPTKPCECGGKNWERVAMREERKVHQEKLQVRGEERTFVNT